MISAKFLAKTAEKFITDNSPVILTGVGAVGTVAGVVLAAKAGHKSALDIEFQKVERWRIDPQATETVPDISFKDKVQIVWLNYAPAAGVCTVSVASILFANRISTKRAAALAVAYSLSEKQFGEYRDKVVEKFNGNKERQIRDEVAQDRVNDKPVDTSTIIITGKGTHLCYDQKSDRYFKNDMEGIRRAENDVNQQANSLGYATVADFYNILGMGPTPYSEELGWTPDKLLQVQFSAVLSTDNEPVIAIDYAFEPIRSYARNEIDKGCDTAPPF